MKNEKLFRNILLAWHGEENKRTMPWKGEKDAYKVWLSEIILQQTRVEQGWSYYEKFISQYPTIIDLALANDEEVFKLWEGLGYYTRCKNLLHTARFIHKAYNGNFPSDYQSILALKGVGTYTAAAIASFCFNLPYAVIDGNVLRVLSRFFGIDTPVDSKEGKKIFTELAQDCLDKNNPAEYNQSIMDFGATVCKPVPECGVCPLRNYCTALKQNEVDLLPVKQKSIVKKERWFSYFIFSFNHKTFVQQRTARDIWQNLYEFYLEETPSNPEWNEHKIKKWLSRKLNIPSTGKIYIIPAIKQVLTHQVIRGYFIKVELEDSFDLHTDNGKWLTIQEMEAKAFPKFLHQFIKIKKLQLEFL